MTLSGVNDTVELRLPGVHDNAKLESPVSTVHVTVESDKAV